MDKNFDEKLAQSIKVAGQWMIDNADSIAAKPDGKTGLSIDIEYDFSGDIITPEIGVHYSHFSVEAATALF